MDKPIFSHESVHLNDLG